MWGGVGKGSDRCAALGVQGSEHTEQYKAKHESSLIYEGGTLSYDPGVYGGAFQDRYHIKALQVSPPTKPLKACHSSLLRMRQDRP